MSDPYAFFDGLVAGWRARVLDLIERAEEQEDAAEGVVERGPLGAYGQWRPSPDGLLKSARHNRAVAAGLAEAVADLEAAVEAVEFAWRHVPPPPVHGRSLDEPEAGGYGHCHGR